MTNLRITFIYLNVLPYSVPLTTYKDAYEREVH